MALQDTIADKSFGLHLMFMKIVGLYPFEWHPKLHRFYANFIYIFFTAPVPLLAATFLLRAGETDLDKICETGFVVCEFGVLLVKVLPFKNNPEGIRRTLEHTKRDIFHTYLPEQLHIMKNTIWMSRLMFQMLFSAFALSFITWPLKSFLAEERSFPVGLWLPYDPFEDTTVYWSTFMYIYAAIGYSGIADATLDTLVPALIYHAAAQLKIIKDTMTHLSQRVDAQISKLGGTMCNAEKKKLRCEMIYKKICDCIDHYDAVFEFVLDLENMYSTVVFSQFLASVLVICLCCFRLSVIKPLTVPFIAMLVFTASAFIEIFFYCYTGTILYEESDTLINAIYMSEWYDLDEKSKKALLILMERAKRPIKVTAGKLLDLSLATFTMIIRRSYSLLAVLKNFQ